MAEDQEMRGSEPARRALPALVLGLSIGWLMGLSVAETVASTVAALLALAGGIGAGLYASSRNQGSAVIDLWPLALIGFGIALVHSVVSTPGLITGSSFRIITTTTSKNTRVAAFR